MGDLVLIRLLIIAALGAASYFLKPFYLDGIPAIGVGVVAGIGVVLFEVRIQKVSLRRLIGAAFGSVLGILGAYLISLVIGHAMPGSDNTIPFLQILLLASAEDVVDLGHRGGQHAGDPDGGIGFVDRAEAIDAQVVFQPARAADQPGRAIVAGLGIDLVELDHQLCGAWPKK